MKRSRALILVVCLFVAGCNWGKKDNATVKGVGGKTADELNAQRNQFETSEDPPLTADTHYAAGVFAESQGPTALPQAIKQYEMATTLDPKHAPALFKLGMIYSVQLKDYPKAIDA